MVLQLRSLFAVMVKCKDSSLKACLSARSKQSTKRFAFISRGNRRATWVSGFGGLLFRAGASGVRPADGARPPRRPGRAGKLRLLRGAPGGARESVGGR